MDASEITRILEEAHPDGVTWETHLAFVERMTAWDVDRIVDFQESLFTHFVEGSWALSWGAPAVVLPDGREIPGLNLANELAMQRRLLEDFTASPEISDALSDVIAQVRSEVDALVAVGDIEIGRIAPPPGHVGIPVLDPFVEDMAKMTIARNGKPTRRRVIALANDESLYNARDLVRVLRAAPWALHRKTGARTKGILPSAEEEEFIAGGVRLFRVVHLLERGDERVETVYRWMAPSSEYLATRLGSMAPLTRLLSARTVGSPRFTDLGAYDGGGVPFGNVLDEWVAVPEPPNRLLLETRSLLSGRASRRRHPPMEADAFWGLIDLLDGSASNVDRLTKVLAKRPPEEIRAFAESLADALFALDRPELTHDPDDPEQIPMSEDVFLYFRCSVVAAGRAEFDRVMREGVLREAERDEAGESLLSAVPTAFERRTGREWDDTTHVSYETGSNREAWGSEHSLQDRGWEGWVCVRSRATTPTGEVDTVRKWRTSDFAEAHRLHLDAEMQRAGWQDVRIVDDLRISSRLSPGLIGAPVDWVRVPVSS